MKNPLFLLPFVFLFAITQLFSQQDTISGSYKFHGTVKTKNGEIISGATLFVRKDNYHTSFSADINGEFVIGLQPGEYEITTGSTNSADFKAFIKITDKGLNPDNIVFALDPSKTCCSDAAGVPFPKPVSLPKPPYPPAARAVRATGEVVVGVTIGKEGKVASAIADGGHPLLRAAALAAARGSRFEAADRENRDAKLTYVFLGNEDEKSGLVRYENPYRIKVVSDYVVINTVNADPGPRRSLPFRLKHLFRH